MDRQYLWDALNPVIQKALENTGINEIAANPNGVLWFYDESGKFQEGEKIEPQDVLNFVNAVAHFHNQYLNSEKPYLDAQLPFNGERINITIPPLNDGVSFNIRKHANQIFTLDDYIFSNMISIEYAKFLRSAVRNRKNILISGGPGSGKTTFANALLDEIAEQSYSGERVLILEQIPELQCRASNTKSMRTNDESTMQTLLWIAMRNSPDRIVIGEVRDKSALDLLKAWNTGCPGGIATIHANSAQAALQRLIDLSQEAISKPPFDLVAEAIDVVVQISRDNITGRKVTEVIEVYGYDFQKKAFKVAHCNGGHACVNKAA